MAIGQPAFPIPQQRRAAYQLSSEGRKADRPEPCPFAELSRDLQPSASSVGTALHPTLGDACSWRCQADGYYEELEDKNQ